MHFCLFKRKIFTVYSANLHRTAMTANTFHIALLMSIFALVLAGLGNPIFIPDSYEQIIVAECWNSGTSARLNCENIFPWFRPPLPSLLLSLGLTWIDGFSLMVLLSWMATVCTVGILSHRISELHSDEMKSNLLPYCVIVTVSMAGLVFDLGLLADSKIIALPFVFGALSLLLSSKLGPLYSFGIGFLLGLAFLTRFENLLLVATGTGMILWFSKRKLISSVFYCLGWLPFVGGWGWLLQQETGRLTLSPRYWEQWILPLLDEMPLRWVQDVYGMGIWNPPLRTLALQSDLVATQQSLLDSFSWREWTHWLDMNMLSLFDPAVVILFMFSLLLWFRDPIMRKWIIVFTWVSMPSLAVTILPQGREAIFPVAYAFPMWISIWTWLGLCTGIIIIRSTERLKQGVLFSGLLGLTLLPSSIERPDNIELSTAGLTVQHWLRSYTPSNSIVLSSFETAPIVWLAEREWQEWPSPWEANRRIPNLQNTDRSVYGVVWSYDHHAWYSLSFEEKYYEPEAYFHNGQHSYLIFDLSAETADDTP